MCERDTQQTGKSVSVSGDAPEVQRGLDRMNRRDFVRRAGLATAGLTCSDFLGFFNRTGRADEGSRAFALGAQNKERFIRTMIQTHFIFFFGRELRYEDSERGLYRRLWDNAAAHGYSIRSLLRELLSSPEYLDEPQTRTAAK